MQHSEPSAVDKDGWFSTGDVASIDPLGFMRITDRSKDVIKSGGEWISSIEIENMAVSHEQVCLDCEPLPRPTQMFNSIVVYVLRGCMKADSQNLALLVLLECSGLQKGNTCHPAHTPVLVRCFQLPAGNCTWHICVIEGCAFECINRAWVSKACLCSLLPMSIHVRDAYARFRGCLL